MVDDDITLIEAQQQWRRELLDQRRGHSSVLAERRENVAIGIYLDVFTATGSKEQAEAAYFRYYQTTRI